MPRVTILRRERTVHFPEAREAVDVVEVTFVTDVYGVSSATLAFDHYRPATPEELAAAPRYRMVPVDKSAEDAERKAIQEAIDWQKASPATSFELP